MYDELTENLSVSIIYFISVKTGTKINYSLFKQRDASNDWKASDRSSPVSSYFIQFLQFVLQAHFFK